MYNHVLSALNELGHGLMLLKDAGWRPRRTIVFASWGAEVRPFFCLLKLKPVYISLEILRRVITVPYYFNHAYK